MLPGPTHQPSAGYRGGGGGDGLGGGGDGLGGGGEGLGGGGEGLGGGGDGLGGGGEGGGVGGVGGGGAGDGELGGGGHGCGGAGCGGSGGGSAGGGGAGGGGDGLGGNDGGSSGSGGESGLVTGGGGGGDGQPSTMGVGPANMMLRPYPMQQSSEKSTTNPSVLTYVIWAVRRACSGLSGSRWLGLVGLSAAAPGCVAQKRGRPLSGSVSSATSVSGARSVVSTCAGS